MYFLYRKIFLLAITILILPIFGSAQVLDSIVHLPEVIIHDSSFRRNLPVIFIDKNSFELDITTDLGEILKRQSNVTGIRRGGYAIDPVVRGYRYSQVNVFLDEGIHIEGGCPNRMDPVLSHVEPELVNSIQVVKGPYLMKYGPSSASAIRIITRPDKSGFNKGFGITSITGFDAVRDGFRQHLELRASKQKSFINMSGGLKTAGNYTDGNGIEWSSSYSKKYISTDLGYKINSSEYLVLSYKAAFAKDILFPALPMDEMIDKTQILSAFYQKTNSLKKQSLTISMYHTSVYHVMDNSLRPQYSQIIPPYTGLMQASAKVKTYSTGARIAYTYPLKKLFVKQGIDFRNTIKDGTRDILMIMEMDGKEFTSSRSFNLWNNAIVFNSGFFTELDYRKGFWEMQGVFRMDYNYSNSSDTLVIEKDNTNWFKVRPTHKMLLGFSFQTSYKLNKTNTISISIARSQRAADLQERYIKFLATGYDKYDYLGNPNLDPETNIQADLMYKYRANKMQLYLNLFSSRISNFISGKYLPPSVARPLTMGAPGVKQFQNIDKVFFNGFEAGIEYNPFNQLSLSLNSGYTYAFIPNFEKVIIINNKPTGTEIIQKDPLSEMPAWDTEIRASYKIEKINSKVTLTIKAVSKQNQVSESFYEEKTPGYILTDLALIYSPSKIVSVVTGINNICNVAYYDHLNRKILGSTMKLHEPGRSFFCMLKLKLN